MNLKYEHIPKSITDEINDKLKQLNKHKKLITEREAQHSFMKFLQGLPLTEKQVFDVYTNTRL